MKTIPFAVALTLAVAACNLQAQEGGRPPREGGGAAGGQGGPGGQQGSQGGERKRPTPPIVAALDLNGDGVIDASEIAKASESLKKLDKNGDGKLTQDECMPPRPQGGEGRRGGGQGGGQGGQGGGDGRRGGPGQGGHDGQGPDGQGVAGGGAQRPELEK